VKHGLHFISGLPRSGSTLLSALLRQNPRMHANMSSPLASLVNALQAQMSQQNEAAVFIEDTQREAVLKAVVEAFYAETHPQKVVIDTSRGWSAKLPLIARLWPQSKVVCCVRSPAWILDSLERLERSHPLEPSGIFKFDPISNVYTRAEQVMGPQGMVGHPLGCLREGVYDERRGNLLLVRYESLVREPRETLDKVYAFLGEPAFAHDPDNVEQDYMSLEFDARLGATGLHSVGSKVRYAPRETILPPDLFEKNNALSVWELTETLPKDLKII